MKKIRRFEMIACLLIIWTAAVLEAYALYAWTNESRLLETFDIMDSTPVEGCIETSASLNKLYLNEEQKREVLEDLAKDLGLTGSYEIQKEERESQETMVLKKEGDIGSVHLSISTMNIDMGEGKERLDQYIYVLYRSNKKMDTMLAYQEKIKKALKERDLIPTSNMNFKGEKDGNLTLEEKNKLASRLFHYLKAKEVEAVKEKELYTIYGYSSLLKDSVAYGDNEINLNLAFSYDEEKDVTMFYLAMPYMKTDY